MGHGLLEIRPNENVLEVGFGPGVGIQILAGLTAMLTAAGFSEGQLVQADQSFCALAIKP